MDDIFAGLLAQGQKAEAQLRYALQVEQKREQQMEADRETLALARLREALGLGPEEEAVWQALAPEYHSSSTVTVAEVREAWQLPTWPGCWRGDGRRRYQTPPAGAERL